MTKPHTSSRSILVTGASGQLGPYVVRRLAADGHRVTAWSSGGGGVRAKRWPRSEGSPAFHPVGPGRASFFGLPLHPVDLASPEQVATAFREAAPDVVVHLAAISSVSEAYQNPDSAAAVNTVGTQRLAELCAQHGSRLIYVSTDLVFDGEHAPYREEDAPKPLSVYGATKLAGEAAVLATPQGLVLRLSLLFGPSLSGGTTFFDQQVAALRERRPIRLFKDEWRTPLGLPAAADAIAAALGSQHTGRLHLGGPERLSRYEMGCLLAERLGADASVLIATSRAEAPGEPRPRDTSLDSSRWRELFPEVPAPSYAEAVATLLEQA
jgi:dTDP-4-dehydrorhamnose reductase